MSVSLNGCRPSVWDSRAQAGQLPPLTSEEVGIHWRKAASPSGRQVILAGVRPRPHQPPPLHTGRK